MDLRSGDAAVGQRSPVTVELLGTAKIRRKSPYTRPSAEDRTRAVDLLLLVNQ
jgi:hypothetical protein